MTDLAHALAAKHLNDFEGLEVRSAGIELPGAAGGLREALAFAPIEFHKGGIALGLVSYEAVCRALVETQRQTGGLFDRIAFCQHHPNAKDPTSTATGLGAIAPG